MKHTLLKHFTKWKLHLNAHITETILFSQHHPCLTHPVQIYDTFVPRPQTYSIQASFLTLSTKHLHIITSKATGILCNIFPLVAQDSTLAKHTKLPLYKLLI